MKVGVDIENDIQRASTIRDVVGWENDLVSLITDIIKSQLCFLGGGGDKGEILFESVERVLITLTCS